MDEASDLVVVECAGESSRVLLGCACAGAGVLGLALAGALLNRLSSC